MSCENCERLEALARKFQRHAEHSHQVLTEGVTLGRTQAREFDEVWDLVKDKGKGLPVVRETLKSPWVSGDESIAIIDAIMAMFESKRNETAGNVAAMAEKLRSLQPGSDKAALRQVLVDHQMKRIELPPSTLGLVSNALLGEQK
jgi:hypothetical protein